MASHGFTWPHITVHDITWQYITSHDITCFSNITWPWIICLHVTSHGFTWNYDIIIYHEFIYHMASHDIPWCIWYHMTFPVAIWYHMTFHGAIWYHMTLRNLTCIYKTSTDFTTKNTPSYGFTCHHNNHMTSIIWFTAIQHSISQTCIWHHIAQYCT